MTTDGYSGGDENGGCGVGIRMASKPRHAERGDPINGPYDLQYPQCVHGTAGSIRQAPSSSPAGSTNIAWLGCLPAGRCAGDSLGTAVVPVEL